MRIHIHIYTHVDFILQNSFIYKHIINTEDHQRLYNTLADPKGILLLQYNNKKEKQALVNTS